MSKDDKVEQPTEAKRPRVPLRPLPDVETLNKLLDYNPDTGALTWKPRTPDMFGNDVRNGANGRCNMWNGLLAGQRALAALGKDGYLTGTLCGQTRVRASRVIWKMMTGEEPICVVHENDDLCDLRWSNLRNVDLVGLRRKSSLRRRKMRMVHSQTEKSENGFAAQASHAKA